MSWSIVERAPDFTRANHWRADLHERGSNFQRADRLGVFAIIGRSLLHPVLGAVLVLAGSLDGAGTSPSLTTDGTNLWAFYANSSGNLVYRQTSGGQWNSAVAVTTDGNQNTAPTTLPLSPAGQVPVVWTSGSGNRLPGKGRRDYGRYRARRPAHPAQPGTDGYQNSQREFQPRGRQEPTTQLRSATGHPRFDHGHRHRHGDPTGRLGADGHVGQWLGLQRRHLLARRRVERRIQLSANYRDGQRRRQRHFATGQLGERDRRRIGDGKCNGLDRDRVPSDARDHPNQPHWIAIQHRWRGPDIAADRQPVSGDAYDRGCFDAGGNTGQPVRVHRLERWRRGGA